MRYRLIEKLKSRAEAFLDSAFYNAEKEKWDVAFFNLEQALQFWIKAKLLELYRRFSQTSFAQKNFFLYSTRNFRRLKIWLKKICWQ